MEGGVGVFASSTFCFFDNGRFTSDASVWNQGPAYDATSVNPQSQGRYSIEGQFIDFIYDDGTTVRKAFGFTEKNDWSQIWLNSPVYLE